MASAICFSQFVCFTSARTALHSPVTESNANVFSPHSGLITRRQHKSDRRKLEYSHQQKQISFKAGSVRRRRSSIHCGILPVDPWAPGSVDSQSIASSLFAISLFPYLGFLYHLTKSKTAPKLTLFGFYFLLAFVGATIPAGIYAKIHYGTSLSNVDYLHGGAESLLTITNLFIVLGLRKALRDEGETVEDSPIVGDAQLEAEETEVHTSR